MSSRGGNLQEIADQVQGWSRRVYRMERTGTTLVLSGDSGTGKTLISNRVRAWVESHAVGMAIKGGWPRVPSVEWVDWVDWWYRHQSGKSCRDIGEMMAADVLFLDDIGADSDRFKSGESTALLGQILGKRERKYNVITTNIPRQQWSEKFDKRVHDRLKRNDALYLNFWKIKSYNE